MSQKKFKLSIKCSEWTVHADKSHVLSANTLLNLSTPLLTGSRGPLRKHLSIQRADCVQQINKVLFQYLRQLFHNIIGPYVHYHGFHSWICSHDMQDSFCQVRNRILGKEEYFGVLTAHVFEFEVQWVAFLVTFCFQMYSQLLIFCVMIWGYSCHQIEMHSPSTLGCWGGFLLILPFAAVYSCVPLTTGLRMLSAWTIMQESQHHKSKGAGHCLLLVLPFPREMIYSWALRQESSRENYHL